MKPSRTNLGTLAARSTRSSKKLRLLRPKLKRRKTKKRKKAEKKKVKKKVKEKKKPLKRKKKKPSKRKSIHLLIQFLMLSSRTSISCTEKTSATSSTRWSSTASCASSTLSPTSNGKIPQLTITSSVLIPTKTTHSISTPTSTSWVRSSANMPRRSLSRSSERAQKSSSRSVTRDPLTTTTDSEGP